MAGELATTANGTGHYDFDAVIVGAGFAGCYLLKLLRDQGLRVKVLDANNTPGGVWAQNRYPGARVDCEMPFYGYSHPEIWKNYKWTERYPNHIEIRRYFQHILNVWNLEKDIALNTRVTAAVWDESSHTWTIKTSEGTQIRCQWFLAATGTSYRSHTPDWKGKELHPHFHHSTEWPEDLDLTGTRVAVVGAGASGIQIMQEACKLAKSVTNYIRSPNITSPMRQRKVTDEDIYQVRPVLPHLYKAAHESFGGLPIVPVGRQTFDDTPEQREEVYEEQWNRGGFHWTFGCYDDFIISKEANLEMYKFWVKKTRARMQDPKKRDLLAPLEAPYYVCTKRPSLEQDYYEMCDQPHVEITNSVIQEITKTGVISADGSRDFDIIAVATGFDAVSGGLRTMGIKGRDGLDLDDYWKDGVRTSVGMMVHGFPNMYIAYGPQAPTAFTNGPPFLEQQCEWMANVIRKQRADKFPAVEASKQGEDSWVQQHHTIANMLLHAHTDSWYMGSNIKGKKREMLCFQGGMPMWHQQSLEALKDWSGFDVPVKSHAAGATHVENTTAP